MPLILLATFGVGVGIGVAGAIPSMIVAGRIAMRPALGTGAYASGIVAGSTLAAALAIPLAIDGQWRVSLLALSIGSLLCIVVWLVLSRGPGGDAPATPVPAVRLPWRSRTAWILVLVFGLQSMQFYGVSAWIPNVYIERGWTIAAAGALVAVFNGVGLLTTIGVPLVADRLGARRPQLVMASVVGTAAFVGIALVPDPAYLWVAILGLALGTIFPLVLTLPLDVADDAARVGSVAALMLLGGYVLSSVGPVLLGAARDLTGSFEASLWLLALVGDRAGRHLPAPVAGAAAPRDRTGLSTVEALRRRPGVRHADGVPPRGQHRLRGRDCAVDPDLGGLRHRRVAGVRGRRTGARPRSPARPRPRAASRSGSRRRPTRSPPAPSRSSVTASGPRSTSR